VSSQGGTNTSLPEVRLRPERKTAPARAQVLEATTRLLASTQLHEISVENISQEAGVSRPTFYAYFASKLEIVLELYTLAAAETHSAVSPIWNRPAGQQPQDAVREAIRALVTTWVPHRPIFQAAIELRYTVPEMMAASQETIAHFVHNIGAQLDADRAAGIAPAGPPSRPLVAALVWSTEHALYVASRQLSSDLPDVHAAVEPLETIWLSALYGIIPTP
jgi:TetR/AcrR family transcriptional regulator, ethionamide resistance regulator